MRTTGHVGFWVASALAIASCGSDRATGVPGTTGVHAGSGGDANPGTGGSATGGGANPGSGGTATGTATPSTDPAPSTFYAGGGSAVDPGGRGAPGGNVDVVTTGALSFGAAFAVPAAAPATPADAQAIASLDSDLALTGNAVIAGNLAVNGNGPRHVTVSGGDLFVTGTVRAENSGGDQSLTLEAPDGTIYVTGTIDASSAGRAGENGAALSLTAARIVVLGTVATDGATGGGRGGDIRVNAGGDVTLLGTVRGRGGAAAASAGDAHGGAAATLAIDATGAVQLGGVVDLRGGPAAGGSAGAVVTGGAGGHLTVGATRPPASVTFALDVALDGGDGQVGAGSGGSFALVAGGDFTVAGSVRSRGGSIVAGGNGDGGLAGNFVMDIKTTVGNQVYRPGSSIALEGGASGGSGTAGGGGHLYARSFDGTVTMAGTVSVRGGAARDPGGTGGLGGHVNIFSDNNFDGIGGDLTITPEGVIDASGGAGTIGGSARNDGTPDVAVFPVDQEMIAVLLNADGIHGRPKDGVIDNQGVVIARGGTTGGAGGDIAFHGEGTGGLHDPLSGHLEMKGDGAGPDGQFASE